MRVRRVSLDETEAGKKAIYRSECGRVEFIWLCPRDRAKEGDSVEFWWEGRRIIQESMIRHAQSWMQSQLRTLGDCYDCGRFGILTGDHILDKSERCPTCYKAYCADSRAYYGGLEAVEAVEFSYGLVDYIQQRGRKEAVESIKGFVHVTMRRDFDYKPAALSWDDYVKRYIEG